MQLVNAESLKLMTENMKYTNLSFTETTNVFQVEMDMKPDILLEMHTINKQTITDISYNDNSETFDYENKVFKNFFLFVRLLKVYCLFSFRLNHAIS